MPDGLVSAYFVVEHSDHLVAPGPRDDCKCVVKPVAGIPSCDWCGMETFTVPCAGCSMRYCRYCEDDGRVLGKDCQCSVITDPELRSSRSSCDRCGAVTSTTPCARCFMRFCRSCEKEGRLAGRDCQCSLMHEGEGMPYNSMLLAKSDVR